MKLLIFDTETTDLIANSLLPDNQQPHLIEFFGHYLNDQNVVEDELHFMCNPGFKLQKVTTDITGITDEMLADKPPFKEFEGPLRGFFGGATAMLAHNLSYDYQIISTELRRCGTSDKMKWPMIRICTVQETEWLKGHRLSQSALYELLFGKTFSGAHRARSDVEALTEIVIELRKRGDL